MCFAFWFMKCRTSAEVLNTVEVFLPQKYECGLVHNMPKSDRYHIDRADIYTVTVYFKYIYVIHTKCIIDKCIIILYM